MSREFPGSVLRVNQAMGLSSVSRVRSCGSFASSGMPVIEFSRLPTSIIARSMFCSMLNSRLIQARPERALLSISSSPSRPLSASSWRSTISRSTSIGAAPGQAVRTLIKGLRTSGVSWTGMV